MYFINNYKKPFICQNLIMTINIDFFKPPFLKNWSPYFTSVLYIRLEIEIEFNQIEILLNLLLILFLLIEFL